MRRNLKRKPEPKPSSFNLTIEQLKGPALALGVLLLLIGIGALLVNGFDTPTRVLLAIGILLLGVFISIDPEDVWRRIKSPGALYSGNTLLLAAAIIGILGLINVVAQNRHQRWDLTANNQYSLSDQTKKILSTLPAPVLATAFYSDDDSTRQQAQDLLKEYELNSGGKLSVEFVDPIKDPLRAQQAGIKELGTTVMTSGDRRQTVSGARESDFTSALLRLINQTQKKVYFTTGHNERTITGFEPQNYGQLKTALESDNYVVDQLLLAASKEVPADAAVVVVAQPRNPFSDDEKAAIKTYLDGGGKLMILTQPSLPPSQQQVPLGDLVSKYGLEIGSAPIVEDNPQNAFPRNPSVTPVIAVYPVHKITEGLGFTLFPTVTHLSIPQDPPGDATITALAQTTDRSWAEATPSQLTDARTLKYDEGTDPKGPLVIAAAIEVPLANAPAPSPDQDPSQQKKTRIVVFGDADFVANDTLSNPQIQSSNRDLFMNSTNWLAEEEQLIAIRPKQQDSRQVFLTAAQQNLVLFSSTLFVPLIVLGLGGFVWWSRR
jgi:ABC-type uncharacterized transport system involved in gliding motility auxiliary subunit